MVMVRTTAGPISAGLKSPSRDNVEMMRSSLDGGGSVRGGLTRGVAGLNIIV